jgi:pyruvate/2-oxoacid:ferredoxin oxidoreductase beta subunit
MDRYKKGDDTMKEEVELLAPGHRMCAGCGVALSARIAVNTAGRDTIVVSPTGCMEVTTTQYPETAWRVPFIHVAFENAAAAASGIDSALRMMGKREGKNILVLAGDGGTFDIGIQALSGMFERGHKVTFICNDNEAYMNCLSPSSLVMTKEGLKRVAQVKVEEKVYAFNQKDRTLTLKRCTGVFNNGIRGIYMLKTSRHSIKATPNHPFLVLKRNGREKGNELIWKTLWEVKLGDKIVALKNLDRGEPFEMEKVTNVSYIGKEQTLDLRVEDEHNFIADGIVVHNTGIQRCSATPYGAWTTTSPPGKYSIGESRVKKPLARIAAAHCIPYAATATIAYVADYQKKVRKALDAQGPSLIHVLATCPTGWRFPPEKMIEVSRLAVQTGIFPLWEVENGEMENLRITKKIPKRKPVEEYLKVQGRFKHLFKPTLRKDMIDKIQTDVDRKFERLGL